MKRNARAYRSIVSNPMISVAERPRTLRIKTAMSLQPLVRMRLLPAILSVGSEAETRRACKIGLMHW
jgi:hypothetical protein